MVGTTGVVGTEEDDNQSRRLKYAASTMFDTRLGMEISSHDPSKRAGISAVSSVEDVCPGEAGIEKSREEFIRPEDESVIRFSHPRTNCSLIKVNHPFPPADAYSLKNEIQHVQ